MAFIRRCLCCDVRVGTMAVACWSMILSVASVIQTVRAISVFYVNNPFAAQATVLACWCVMILLNACLGVTAIVLVVGICKNKKQLFVPFMIVQAILAAVYAALAVILFVTLSLETIVYFNFLSLTDPGGVYMIIVYWVMAGLLTGGVGIEVICLLCVVSQYQELRDGRGLGLPETTTTTTVILVPKGSYVNQGADVGIDETRPGPSTEPATSSASRPKCAEPACAGDEQPVGVPPPSKSRRWSSSSSSEHDSDHD
ncbi:uncharacterized protein LOC110979115 [Acanthaster planci]|uniref:Uncharacterized protein LOC110979115 n=1 Tax=Acanthaster planci TaxID=133434 RepID=A0A8B7YAS4_ACAPL|nr:uncharacterized protein LOC110979115 [Acanthaster planci]